MPALKKILCALDLSDQSESVAEYAVMLAKMSGASIVAVYAAPTLTQYTGFHVPPNTIDNFVGEIVSGAERSMTDFVSEHFTGVDARGVVVVGYAAEENPCPRRKRTGRHHRYGYPWTQGHRPDPVRLRG